MNKNKVSLHWKTIGIVLISFLLGLIVAHFIWLVAIQGLVESNVITATLAGQTISGRLLALEVVDGDYIAKVNTDKYGLLLVSVSEDTYNSINVGTDVEVCGELCLKPAHAI